MNGFAVATIFSAVDKFSPVLNKAQGNVNKFAVGAKAAFRSVVPEASRLNDVIKGVTIGNLLTKGITTAVNAIRSNFSNAVTYASSLIEVQNIVDTVFGESSKTIDDFAKSAGKNFGLTELQAKKFSSTFGAILSGIGIKGDLGLGISTNLTGLAGDLASFYNMSQEEAFSKLQSGLMGKTQPLQSIGIDVSATSMEEFAKAQGKVWKNMNRTNQTLLRYQYIMEKTKLAQGDYMKPIDSWAVSSRNATNSIQEMFGKLAVGLMPTLIKLADLVTATAQKIGAWADENKRLIATKLEKWVNNLIGFTSALVKITLKYGPAILTAVVAIKAFSMAKAVYQGITVAVQAYNAMLAAQKAATAGATVAQHGLNAAMKANIIGLIVAAVILLIGLFMQLASKVGGVKNAFIVVGQTFMKWVLTPVNFWIDAFQLILPIGARIGVVLIESFKAVGQTLMKWLLTPINFVIEGIKGILTIASKLPGKAGGFAKDALGAIGGFQGHMNTMLTGSDSTLFNSGTSALLDPARGAKDVMADKIQAAEKAATAGVTGIQSFQDKMNVTLTGSDSTLFNSGPGYLADPYRNARAAELERQAEAAGEEEDPMGETNDLLAKILARQGDEIGAINDLNDSGPNSPKNLRWNKMGAEDYWSVARAGI